MAASGANAIKNTILWVVLLLALGGVTWRFFGDRSEPLPDTPESTTVWVCETCGHTEELTAKQLAEARSKAEVSRSMQEGNRRTSTRETLLLCPECKTLTMACGNKCTVCGKGILGGESGMCPTCAKSHKPTGRGR